MLAYYLLLLNMYLTTLQNISKLAYFSARSDFSLDVLKLVLLSEKYYYLHYISIKHFHTMCSRIFF